MGARPVARVPGFGARRRGWTVLADRGSRPERHSDGAARPAEPPAGSEHFPAYWFFSAGLSSGELTVVLLPREWHIDSGDFQGERAPLGLEGAFGQTCAGCPVFWGVNPNVLGPPAHWPSDAFPVPVAMDREHSTAELAGQDSVELWDSIEHLEAGLGRDLFRPAELDDFEPRANTNLGYDGLVTVRVAEGQEFAATGVRFSVETGRSTSPRWGSTDRERSVAR